MARRSGIGGGMTALRVALGAVAGGLEGRSQQQSVEAEKKRMADALARQQGLDAMDRARFLMSSGFRVAPEAYTTEDPAARSVLPPLEMPTAAPSSGARAGGALSAALNRGMGVDTTQPSLSRPGFGAAPLAMDSGVSRMTDVFSRAQETRPAQEAIAASVDLPDGMKMRFNAPESAAQIAARTMADYEAKKKADAAIAAQAKADERKAEGDAKNADMALAKAAWKAAGLSDAKAEVAARTGAKYGDVMMSDKDMKTLGISYAQLKLAQDRFKFDQGKAEGETPRGEMMNGLQAMGKARAATALNLLETNTKIMKQFEDDLSAGKLKMTGVQLEAARKALAGTPGSAIAEEALNKGNFLIDKNPALLRYVRAGKSIASAVREITPRGGSNLMMQMEIALSGIGPGGTDPESLAQVDAFRNDLLSGVRSGVEAMTGKPSGGTSMSNAATPSVDADYEAAKQAIANGADPAAVRRRYEEGTNKKWPGA